ncbi:hypothetical protein, partial [Vibrio parahaemolyticus]|uniref:hypothetical protein n=2 Tax=Vibrio TaxID=662 RepID=UPI001BAEA04B
KFSIHLLMTDSPYMTLGISQKAAYSKLLTSKDDLNGHALLERLRYGAFVPKGPYKPCGQFY